MTRPIHLAVFGVPHAKGSARAVIHRSTGRAVLFPDRSASLRTWEQAIAQAARDWQDAHSEPLLDEPVAMRVEFFLPRPKSIPAWRAWPAGKPDCDKLARSLDPLSGIIYRDDSQVVRLKVTKRYADTRPPGVDITITPLGAQMSPRARARLLSEEG